jgi:hypothetical protein
MRQSLASLTGVVLRNGATANPSLGKDGTLTQQPICRGHDPQSEPSSATIPIAPIQAVRRMNSWITGQRPDGKQDLQASSTTKSGAAVDEKYIDM